MVNVPHKVLSANMICGHVQTQPVITTKKKPEIPVPSTSDSKITPKKTAARCFTLLQKEHKGIPYGVFIMHLY